LMRNFSANVELWESPDLSISPNPEHDPTDFESLDSLRSIASAQGYYGGLRLILATCKKFADVCAEGGLILPGKNFTIRYHTDIPRQVGLGGSSAIISAAFQALVQFYGVSERDVPLAGRPNIILQVETAELAIQAGLQDRVIAVYGGLVYMDFNKTIMDDRGHGHYERLDPDLLPPLFVAWGEPAGESGTAHQPIRVRWEDDEPGVRETMARIASCAEAGKDALFHGDVGRLGELMNENFDLRVQLYTPEALGEQTMRLVEIAREHGCPAKLPGSGGAAIGLAPADEKSWQALVEAYEDEGFYAQRVLVDGTTQS
jgi:glucuronokinase